MIRPESDVLVVWDVGVAIVQTLLGLVDQNINFLVVVSSLAHTSGAREARLARIFVDAVTSSLVIHQLVVIRDQAIEVLLALLHGCPRLAGSWIGLLCGILATCLVGCYRWSSLTANVLISIVV